MNSNITCWQTNKINESKHHFVLPSPKTRLLIIGRTDCGNTSLLLKMLLVNGWVDYNEIYAQSKALHQPEYKILKAGFDKGHIVKIFSESNNVDVAVDEYIKNLPTKGKPKISISFYESFESILLAN